MSNEGKSVRLSQLKWWARATVSVGVSLLPDKASDGIRRGVLHRAMRSLHDALEGTPMAGRYWLDGGLLLGWARSGDALAHDTQDVDFNFLSEDFEKMVAAVPAVKAAGFSVLQVIRDSTGEAVCITFKKYGIQFDFLKVVKVGDSFVYRGVFQAPVEVTLERPTAEFDELELFGRRWLKPVDVDRVLTGLYGDWRKPDPDWRTDRDCPSTVRRRPWQWTNTMGHHEGDFAERITPTLPPGNWEPADTELLPARGHAIVAARRAADAARTTLGPPEADTPSGVEGLSVTHAAGR